MTYITLTASDRPLRRDAERNRQRILDAARELFAQRGLGVTLNDVAHHAGVGVGTVYRRFPDKARLIDELFEQRVEELVAFMEEAVADPDPWHGLIAYLEKVVERTAHDQALKEIVISTPDGVQRVCRIRDRLLPRGLDLVRRAQESGRLRPDVAATDVPIIQMMLSAVIDASRDVDPELWRRYLQIIIRGIATDPDAAGATASPTPPPLSPDQIDVVMTASARSPH